MKHVMWRQAGDTFGIKLFVEIRTTNPVIKTPLFIPHEGVIYQFSKKMAIFSWTSHFQRDETRDAEVSRG